MMGNGILVMKARHSTARIASIHNISDQPQHRCDEHDFAIQLLGMDESQNSFINKKTSQHPDQKY